jgi:hypothetical protein
MSPNAGGGGELQGLSQLVQLYAEAQINFGDLTVHAASILSLIGWIYPHHSSERASVLVVLSSVL